MFNYTPLEISGDCQKYVANIIKQTQTGINRSKIHFLHYEIIEAPKKF
jgi:hypothetical protein